jgi:hypothetical protein
MRTAERAAHQRAEPRPQLAAQCPTGAPAIAASAAPIVTGSILGPSPVRPRPEALPALTPICASTAIAQAHKVTASLFKLAQHLVNEQGHHQHCR